MSQTESHPAQEPGSSGTELCSIVVPMFNEEPVTRELYRRIVSVMEAGGRPFEMVFVNDGSRDNTLAILKELALADARVLVVDLRRNFGQTPALAAGFDHARGDIIIAMDGDLQHSPEDIPLFLTEIDKGYDLVSGWRKQRVDNLLMRRIPSRVANWLMNKLSGLDLHDFGTTFKAYRRDLLEHIKLYGEMHRFIPALASAAGARVKEIPIQNIVRPRGKSNYGISRTFRVMMDLITVKFILSYMTRPMHLFGLLGLGLLVVGGIIDVFLVVQKVVFGVHIMLQHGPLTMLSVLLVLMGMLCIITGLLGEVLARTYYESTGRRIYTVRRVYNGGKPRQ